MRAHTVGLAAGVLVLLSLLMIPSPAVAHARLLASTPAEGEVLDELPDQVTLEFTETMSSPAYVIVRAPDGESVTRGEPEVRGAVVTQVLADGALPGTYSIAYRAVSRDGHPLTGEVAFSVGEPAETRAPAPAAAQPAPSNPPRVEVDAATRRIDVGVPAVLFALALLLLALSRRQESLDG